MQLRALYGGRHLRTTLVLAGASAAAGALTGLVGIGATGTPAAHATATTPHPSAKPVHHHARPHATAHRTVAPRKVSPSPSPSHSPSPTASATPTPRHSVAATATASASGTPEQQPQQQQPTAAASTPAATPAASMPASGTTPPPAGGDEQN